MPLTATAIRKAKPREKPRKLYDSRGLYLEIAPRGTKAWRFKYRFAGKEKRISMGIYPEVSLKLARERRDDARKLLARDIDPSAYRKARKRSRLQGAGNSFEAVATEWLTKHSPNWSTGWARRLERELGREVCPYIGASPVADITAPDLLAVVRRVEARGHLNKAHTVFQACGRVLRYAVATGRAERDVSADLRGALPSVKTKHFAAITDPKEVGPLLRQLDGYTGTLPVRCALRFAPLVFVRLGELVTAEWDGIDLEGAEWRYTVTKTGRPHVVPLARQAVAILREVRPITGHHRYVFPNARHSNRELPMSRGTLWSAFRALDIPKERMTMHGFRAMARTILDEVLGFRPDFIEHQLAHAVRDPNGRAYNRTAFLPERRVMMQAWADYLDDLRAGKIEPGTSVETSPRGYPPKLPSPYLEK
jgi:integrase